MRNKSIKRSRLPFVLVNMAITADGKIATANRAVHSFGSARDLEHLYELRATADAVICGARTLEISGATLGNGGKRFRALRRKRGLSDFPLRVIVSGSGSIDPRAKIFQKSFSPIVLLTTKRAGSKRLAKLRQLSNEVKVGGARSIDFRSALRWLRSKWKVRRLLCEGGGELNAALFQERLVDELHLTICPKIFGGKSAPTIADGVGVAQLGQAFALQLKSFNRVGDEIFAIFRRRKRSS